MEGKGGGVSHCTLLLCCPTDTMVELLTLLTVCVCVLKVSGDGGGV